MLADLLGLWIYSGLVFHGQPINKPNPDLVIYYQFSSERHNTIFYFRQGERGFCERLAEYKVENKNIVQTNIAANENNADFCDQDPDMQMNRLSITEFEIVDGKLLLHLPLGEDRLTYVWTKIF